MTWNEFRKLLWNFYHEAVAGDDNNLGFTLCALDIIRPTTIKDGYFIATRNKYTEHIWRKIAPNEAVELRLEIESRDLTYYAADGEDLGGLELFDPW